MKKMITPCRTLILALMIVSTSVLAGQKLLDEVAARVNHNPILESDVRSLLDSVKLDARVKIEQLPDESVLRHQVIERLIMDNIQQDLAEKLGITIDDRQVDQALQDIAARNQMSYEQFRSRIVSEGIDYKAYRAQIRKEMLISEVRNNQVSRRIQVLPQEVETLAKQLANEPDENAEFNLNHILIPISKNASQEQITEAGQLARKIATDLREGADFTKAAIAYSSDPQAFNGGQMGWNKLAEIPQIFAEQIKSSKPGAIIGPIRSGVGFHLLRINDIRNEQQNLVVDEIHARHILIRTSLVVTDDQAKGKLGALSQELKNGADFADLAKKFSEDPGSAAKGGDLGWATPNTYDPIFRNALLKLNQGEISPPVHSSFGWHLIQRLDTRRTDKTEVALKDRAYRMIFNRKFSEEVPIWLQEERANASIKITEPNGNQ